MPWEHGLQEFKVMIKKDEIFKIGIFNKPHGVKGEVSFTFTIVWIVNTWYVCWMVFSFRFLLKNIVFVPTLLLW